MSFKNAVSVILFLSACRLEHGAPVELDSGEADSGVSCDGGARAPAPLCERGCTALCGCEACTYQSSQCGGEYPDSSVVACDEARGCFDVEVACGATARCTNEGHFASCVPVYSLDGVATGIATPLKLTIYDQWCKTAYCDVNQLHVELKEDGHFTIEGVRGAFGVFVSSPPAGLWCRVTNATGNAAGGSVPAVTVACSSTAFACELGGLQCFPNTASCPYDLFELPERPPESSLSCDPSGNPTQGTKCCRDY
jgi:hypothetical protein